MHWSMTLEICPHEWKYKNHYKNLVLFLIFTEILQAQKEKNILLYLEAFFSFIFQT